MVLHAHSPLIPKKAAKSVTSTLAEPFRSSSSSPFPSSIAQHRPYYLLPANSTSASFLPQLPYPPTHSQTAITWAVLTYGLDYATSWSEASKCSPWLKDKSPYPSSQYWKLSSQSVHTPFFCLHQSQPPSYAPICQLNQITVFPPKHLVIANHCL